MPRVVFTTNLQRHVPCPPAEARGQTVRAALDAVFAGNPQARGYVLDEQGALRKHMLVFVDGRQVEDRINTTVDLFGNELVDQVSTSDEGPFDSLRVGYPFDDVKPAFPREASGEWVAEQPLGPLVLPRPNGRDPKSGVGDVADRGG